MSHQQGSTDPRTLGYGQPGPYGSGPRQGLDEYEMQNDINGTSTNNDGYPLSINEFLDRVQRIRNEIRNLTVHIDFIGQLHQRTLSTTDGSANAQLEQYVSQTQIRNTAIKDGIKGLERDQFNTTDHSRITKETQIQSLKTFFTAELDKYQSIERDYKQRYREQIARQYRIVNPEATEQEVQQATETDWGDEGVFQTALRTNRTGHANSILGNVRARHNELQRIEQTLNELTKLYEELATVIEQQDPVVQVAEENAQLTTENMKKGNEEVATANKHARNRRKLKWWCALIVFLVLLAIGLGVGLGVSAAKKATNKR